ncbi:MAG: hydrolase 2, exosortase A system-associated [Alphaproteobacteria bacterium]|nr:MAG: hydrolase 2, exosortase A system-associated [Alphaproteobacteria bacterium]
MTQGGTAQLRPYFADGPRGPLFCLDVEPAAAARRGHLLLIAPFAEELNRSRRMMITLARRLAFTGFAATIADLHGTGDSAGRFADASWRGWLDDLAFLRREIGDRGPLWLAGIRTGALLAAAAMAEDRAGVVGALMIAPVSSGARFLAQFLRIRIAAEMARDRRETTAALKARLEAGETLPVGGYALTPDMARALSEASLAKTPPPDVPVLWFDVAAQAVPEGELRARLPEVWRRNAVRVHGIADAAFWSLQEPTVPARLIDGIVARLEAVA